MKKGFTLIELLAVILILGIIALIAVPQVTNTIEKSKKGAAETSAKHYIDAVTNAIGLNQLDEDESNDINDGTHSVAQLTVDISGEAPSSGTVVIEEGSVKSANFVINGYTVICTGKGKCTVQGKNKGKGTSGLYDKKDNLLASWDELVNNYGMDINWCADGECWDNGYYMYFSQEDVDDWANSGYGITTSGWYYYENEVYTLVDINTIDSNQPNIVFVKLGGTKLVIDKSIKSIPEYAFGDSFLTSVTIPNSVTTIGDYAFAYNQLTSVTIPDSVTSIGDSAFDQNQLTSVTIGNGVTSIGIQAFNENRLTSVTLGNSVTSIGNYAFAWNQLTSVIIPDSVTSIGDYAFQYNQLTSVTIPDSVTSIGTAPFNSIVHKNLIITIDPNNSKYESRDNCNCIIEKETNKLIEAGKNGTIPNGVTSIEHYAFRDNQLTSVTIPNSVTSIGFEAFAWNRLTSVTIPDSVTSIDRYAFQYNSNLTSVTFNNPTGWTICSDIFTNKNGVYSCRNGAAVENVDLSNPSTNATYLKDTYLTKAWIRN